MKRKYLIIAALLVIGGVGLLAILVGSNSVPVLEPKGIIAAKERDLLVTATLLSFIVVLPVFIMTFYISWKYRASNKKAKYSPEWDGHRGLETIWWGVPLILIIILSVIIFKSSHDLDPFKPIASSKKPITVQVVSMQWKWLFIYPDMGIASVNLVQFPEDTPINFDITSDAPMNSFWIPQLGGQIYAMSGMSTKLHLMADEPGDYRGSSANISGEGFADMKFTARASSQAEFDQWVLDARRSSDYLTMDAYKYLKTPSTLAEPRLYVLAEPDLYNKVIIGYTGSNANHSKTEN